MARHNELHDGVAELASKAINPMHICDYPKNTQVALCMEIRTN